MFIKKTEYIIDDLLQGYIKTKYPNFTTFIKLICSYFDGGTFYKIYNIENNLNFDDIYDELIDLYLDDYFTQNFDLTKYHLTNENKKRFLNLSRRINSLKGTSQSYIIFYQLLTNFIVAVIGGYIEFPYFSDILIYETDRPEDILKYFFKTTNNQTIVIELIDNLHPCGVQYEARNIANYDGLFDHDYEIDYSGQMIMGGMFYYDGLFIYDGKITYGGTYSLLFS